MLERVRRKENHPTLLKGIQIDATIMENSMEVPSKTKNWGTIWPWNPTADHISRLKHDPKGYVHPNVHCSTVYNNQDMEAT